MRRVVSVDLRLALGDFEIGVFATDVQARTACKARISETRDSGVRKGILVMMRQVLQWHKTVPNC